MTIFRRNLYYISLLTLFFCLTNLSLSYAWPLGPRGRNFRHIPPRPPKADVIPPTGRISINNNNRYTNSTQVTLKLTAQDNPGGSGLSTMQFSNDSRLWSSPEPFCSTKSWDLRTKDGPKRVYARFKDKAGNLSRPYSDIIILDTHGPSIEITSPQEWQVIR